MRKHVLTLASSVAIALACSAFGANAQPGPGYGGWHDQAGGRYGEWQEQRSRDYRPRWGRDYDGGYGRRGRDRSDGGRWEDGSGRRPGAMGGQAGMMGHGMVHHGMMHHGMMHHGMMHHGMMGSAPMGPAIMRMMLTLMDTDGDGTVSLSEFQAAHERIFKAADADKDGRLTMKEVQAFFQGQGETTQSMSGPAQRGSNPGPQSEGRPAVRRDGPTPSGENPSQFSPPAGAQEP